MRRTMDNLLEVNDLHHSYGTREVLKGITRDWAAMTVTPGRNTVIATACYRTASAKLSQWTEMRSGSDIQTLLASPGLDFTIRFRR